MTSAESFLTPNDETEVIKAIRLAETNTSGEIRVHIESHTDADHFERAVEVFHRLNMHQTRQRNGVLIYIATLDHKFYILGDVGINQVVPDNFWESTKEVMATEFKKGDFKEGIVKGVFKAGEQLKKYFPYRSDDQNELPNTLSKS